MAARGFGQRDVDDMELWIIAEVLGFHHQTADRALTAEEHRKQGAALAAERVRRAAAGLPAPTATPTGPVATPAMVEALKRRRLERGA